MLRVLHYVGKMDRGGMETLIMNIYRNIDRSKIQFDFAIHGDRNGDFEDEILELGGKFYRFPIMRKNPITYRYAWRKFWKEHANVYTAFHFHTNSLANIIAFEEAFRSGVRMRIVHSHSSSSNKGKLQSTNIFLHKLHRNRIKRIATNLFACSNEASQWLFGGNKLGDKRVLLLKNGVDVNRFKFNQAIRDQMRLNLGLQEKKVIGHIGSFINVKNHEFLLDIIDNAHKKNPNIRAIFIGDGLLRTHLTTIVKSRKLESIVQFLGVRKDVSNLLSAMDLFIFPSLYEGLPVSLVEVQANGLPALVSDSITNNVKINNNIEYISLHKGTEYWSQRALIRLESDKHSTDVQSLIEAGFDISDTVDEYVNILQSK